jgi:hypothetical protein
LGNQLEAAGEFEAHIPVAVERGMCMSMEYYVIPLTIILVAFLCWVGILIFISRIEDKETQKRYKILTRENDMKGNQ